MIGSEMTYNFEFLLRCSYKHTNFSLHLKVLGTCLTKPSPKKPTSHRAGKSSKPEKELTGATSVNLEKPHLVVPTTDSDTSWEICKIIDRKAVEGEKHYRAKWEDSWMSKLQLAGARELIREYETKLPHANERSSEPAEVAQNGDPTTVQGRISRGRSTKKSRSRPRKQN